MLVLAVDTSTPQVTTGIVSLPDAPTDTLPTLLAGRSSLDARAHNEVLVPLIVECLDEAGVTRADLDAVVVGCGPGPFTGLRVGMVTAAAFADALGIPVYGVCSLDSMVADGDSLVVTDARRREVYVARYADGARVWGPAVLKATDVPAESGGVTPAVIRGSEQHATQVAEAFGAPIEVEAAFPTPEGLVRAALEEIRSSDEPAPLVPLYLRRPDAVPPTPRKPSAALKFRSPGESS